MERVSQEKVKTADLSISVCLEEVLQGLSWVPEIVGSHHECLPQAVHGARPGPHRSLLQRERESCETKKAPKFARQLD
jgi:hypothetical protein